MIELTYIGDAIEVIGGANVPFNNVMKSGTAERYVSGSNKIVLARPGRYLVTASANIAIPADGIAATPVQLAIAADGDAVVGTVMFSTPAGTSQFNNVSAQTYIDVYPCAPVTVSLKNSGTAALEINNQNLIAVRVA